MRPDCPCNCSLCAAGKCDACRGMTCAEVSAAVRAAEEAGGQMTPEERARLAVDQARNCSGVDHMEANVAAAIRAAEEAAYIEALELAENKVEDAHDEVEECGAEGRCLACTMLGEIRARLLPEIARRKGEVGKKPTCQHDWTDARNSVISSGEICLKCNAIRAGNQTQKKREEKPR